MLFPSAVIAQRRLMAAAAAALAAFLAALLPPAAAAAPDCPTQPKVNYLAQGQGKLESVIVTRAGRLIYSDLSGHRLLRLDSRGAEPTVLARFPDPGGLALTRDGSLIAGTSNSAKNGLTGDLAPRAALLRVDPNTGATSAYASGLSMANGLDRAPDGSLYATNDFGRNVDRVVNGEVEHGWAKVPSGNGVVAGSSGRYIYVAQTFQPAAIQRIDVNNPADVRPYAVAEPGPDWLAGLDGMTRDSEDNLFVAANGAGEVWKVDGRGSICVLLRGLPAFPDGPSAVATGNGGRGSAFPTTSLYVVTFGGDLIELEGVAAPNAASPTE